MSFVIVKNGKIVSSKAYHSSFDEINSYTYTTNDIVFIKFQIFNQDLSWCLVFSS